MANILVETVVHRPGHRNSKGELAEWVIIQHDTGKLLSSHKSKAAAEKHLKQMEYYKHAKNESIFGSFLKKAPIAESIRTAAIRLFKLF